MAEQYLSAFAVDSAAFAALVGSDDDSFVRAAVAAIDGPAAGTLLRAHDPGEAAAALRDIAAGRPDPTRPGGYTWLLELLGPTAGVPVGAHTLPGRRWHLLGRALLAWELPVLAGLWCRPWGFPFGDRAPDPDPWPFPALATAAELDLIGTELAALDPGRIHSRPELLPHGDDGDGEWEDDAEEAEYLLCERLPGWVAAARAERRDLLLVRDGGR
ncbi:hypothetical protein ACWDR0_11920 [Streptomyces sp. NPDC003691]